MDEIRIYQPEGESPYTRRVALSEAESHIAARDQLADESRMLQKFDRAEHVPKRIGDYVLQNEGEADGVRYFRYVRQLD